MNYKKIIPIILNWNANISHAMLHGVQMNTFSPSHEPMCADLNNIGALNSLPREANNEVSRFSFKSLFRFCCKKDKSNNLSINSQTNEYDEDGTKTITQIFEDYTKIIQIFSPDGSLEEKIYYDINSIEIKREKKTIFQRKLKELWSYGKCSILGPTFFACSMVGVSYVRNILFINLNNAIADASKDAFKYYALYFFLIQFANIMEYFFIKSGLDALCSIISTRNRSNEMLFHYRYDNDLSHRIFADQKHVVEYHYKMSFYIMYCIMGAAVFVPSFIIEAINTHQLKNSLYIIAAGSPLSIAAIFLVRHLSTKYSKRFMDHEEALRELTHSWTQQTAVINFEFPTQQFQRNLIQSRNAEIVTSWTAYSYQLFQVSLSIIPYLIFANQKLNGHITYKEFSTIVGFLNGMLMPFCFIETAIDFYGKYKASKIRLENITPPENINYSHDNIIAVNNLKVKYDDKSIINCLNFRVLQSEKIHIYAPHATGKSSIFCAINGSKNFEGNIDLPQNIIKISEKFYIPQGAIVIQTGKFRRNCELLNVDPDKNLTQASASEKFRLVAASALCNDFIIWDDPFSCGEQYEVKKFLNCMCSGIIFSAQKDKLEGFKNYILKLNNNGNSILEEMQ